MTARHPWHDTGVWLMGDTHVHHRQTGLQRVVEGAARFGCDYLAFTEHSFYTESLESQPGLIEKAGDAHPAMLLVNGTEWSAPVGDETRAEQVGLLVPGGAEGMPFLREFLSRFDTRVAGIKPDEETFLEALRFLGTHGRDDVRPTVILTHPHRPQAAFTADQIRAALETGPALAALCGSSRPPRRGELDVWPWVSDVGGVYDQVLAGGQRLIMLGESHLHKHSATDGGVEFWPGEFRRNYIYCPERSESGFFQGLRAGGCYFVLGGIVEALEFTASATGESVMMGETLSVAPGADVAIRLSLSEKVPLERLELIGNPKGPPRIVASAGSGEFTRSAGRASWTLQLKMPDAPFYLRARGSGRTDTPYPTKGWFYTNPLWLTPNALSPDGQEHAR